MRSLSILPLVLLSITTTSFSAPIPVPVEECSNYASCVLYRPRLSIQSKASSTLQEPHFHIHQAEYSKTGDAVEVSLSESHSTAPTLPLQRKTPTGNSRLIVTIPPLKPHSKNFNWLGHKSLTEANTVEPEYRDPSSRDPRTTYGFAATANKKMQLAAPAQVQRCSMVGPTAESRMQHWNGRMAVSYTYGYSYIRTDHTSVLVVTIVVVFVLCILVIELLSNAIEFTRAFLSLDQGVIRLEDCDCEPSNNSSPCIHAPRRFRLMPAGPSRSERSPTRTSDEVTDEKIPELESEVA